MRSAWRGSRLTNEPWEAVGLALIPGVAKELYDAGQACNRFSWKDMGVESLHTGQPEMRLTGWAAERLAAMTPSGHRAIVHVTLTDDHPWAQAFVVIEALPDPAPEPVT